jgi:uncharacterized protein (DUF1330 family)
MAYYVIFDVTIHDPPKYQEYMAVNRRAIVTRCMA